MTFISKTAGGLSLLSCIHDIHKTALISSNNEYAKVTSNAVISNSLHYQKADRISYKDTQRKNWLAQSGFSIPFKEMYGKVSGYIKGALRASVRYIPNFAFAAIAIFTNKKHKNIANASAVALGVIEAIDFARNSLGIGQRKDYLE